MGEMARFEPELDLEERVPAMVDEAVDHKLDQAGQDAILAAILAQQVVQRPVTSGPEWSMQVRPPCIPGTINAKYTRALLPVRALAFFILWATWDWKRGAFVATVVVLLVAIYLNR